MRHPGQPGPKDLAAAIDLTLEQEYGKVDSFLHFGNPFELLVGVLLSAQSTDAQVNKILPGLFRRWPTPCDWAQAHLEDIEEAVHSTGFFRTKAKHLLLTSRILCAQGGVVPLDFNALIALPGVGRKSAHVLRGTLGGHPAIIVDTHFGRVCRRLGLSSAKAPLGIERDLESLLLAEKTYGFSMRVNLHGRRVCRARKPLCGSCVLSLLCRSSDLQP